MTPKITPTRFLLRTAGLFFVGSFAVGIFASDPNLWILIAGINLGVWVGIPWGGIYEVKRSMEKTK